MGFGYFNTGMARVFFQVREMDPTLLHYSLFVPLTSEVVQPENTTISVPMSLGGAMGSAVDQKRMSKHREVSGGSRGPARFDVVANVERLGGRHTGKGGLQATHETQKANHSGVGFSCSSETRRFR